MNARRLFAPAWAMGVIACGLAPQVRAADQPSSPKWVAVIDVPVQVQSAEDVERRITIPIERRLVKLKKFECLESTTTNDRSTTLIALPGISPEMAVKAVVGALDKIDAELPAGTLVPQVSARLAASRLLPCLPRLPHMSSAAVESTHRTLP